MARIRKIPDTWTLEIHVIVLKDSRQAEHEEIGCMNTTRRSSVYSNTKRGGRGAQKKEMLETKTTRQDEAQRTRTPNVLAEELKRKKCSKQKRHDKMKLSVLEHQTWWERSSKERNARNKNRIRQDEAQRTRTSNVVGEQLKRKKRSKQNETTR